MPDREVVAASAESADVAGAVERAELRQLVRDAIDGLNPGERDVIELSLMQGLDGGELADALGVSRSQLERSLGKLVVARTGRDACTARRPADRVGRAADRAHAQADQPAYRTVRDLRRAQAA